MITKNGSTDHIVEYLEKMLHIDDHVKNAQDYIKENYNINSDYDKETSTIYIYTKNINESLNIVAAEKYLQETIGEDFINIKFGQKE